ncbi:MAG: permease prefix domain 1-containing protein, partial [Planctomycetota bacterium]
MFELEPVMQGWREGLTESLRDEDLEELEGHLREEITQLCAKGLSAEEAFVIAVRRVGGERELCAEFSKVHPRAAATRQFEWMII